MGESYAILLWDGWGGGLTRKNPRLHTDGQGVHGNPRNSWPLKGDDTQTSLLRKRGMLTADQELDELGRIPDGPLFQLLDVDRPLPLR